MRKSVIGVVLAALGASAAAAESITLPAYAPPTNREISYRVQVTTSGSLGDRETKIHGDFHNALTVASRTAQGFRVVWRIDAAEPATPSPGVAYAVNDHYRGTIALYGVTSVALETDRSGAPLRLDDGGAIRRNMETAIRNTLSSAPVPPGTVLDTMLRKIEADPLFPVRALVPALSLVTLMQAQQDTDFEIGKVHARNEEARAIGEMIVPAFSTWSLQSVDRAARTITFTWNSQADPSAVALRAKRYIDGEIEAAQRRNGTLSAQQMSEFGAASARQTGLARISLDDGATVYAEETIATRVGLLRSETTVRVTRE